MKSPKIFDRRIKKSGFSLIELLIAVGILGIISTVGVWASMDVYSYYLVMSKKSYVIGLIFEAETQALFSEDSQTLSIPTDPIITVTGPPTLMFNSLAEMTSDATITLAFRNLKEDITVNHDGTLSY